MLLQNQEKAKESFFFFFYRGNRQKKILSAASSQGLRVGLMTQIPQSSCHTCLPSCQLFVFKFRQKQTLLRQHFPWIPWIITVQTYIPFFLNMPRCDFIPHFKSLSLFTLITERHVCVRCEGKA